MAKKAYIGVAGIARKVKKIYVGVPTNIPIYTTNENTVNIDESNISDVFDVANASYYFVGSDGTFTTNNGGVSSSTAQTKLTAKYGMTISFNYSYSSEANYDKFTLTVGSTTVESAASGVTTNKTYSGAIAAGETIVFTYTKDSSTNSNNDKCTFSSMVVQYSIVEQIGAELKNVARKVKKAYVGIGGVARPCFGSDLEYYGAITPLSAARRCLAAAAVGSCALFGGGDIGSTRYDYYGRVDAYDASLTRSTATGLNPNRTNLAATSVGNYALFGGGYGKDGWSADVEAYDASLTKTTATNLSSSRTNLAATSVGNYALFGGGSINTTYYRIVDAYDASLTRTTATSLSEARSNLASAAVGNYALFGGGYSVDGACATVDAYDASLTRTTATSLSEARSNLASAAVGNYALFGGGGEVVDAYDPSLTRVTAAALSDSRSLLAATSVGNYALFGGGYSVDDTYATVDVYDASLTRTTATSLSEARSNLAATSVGNYALFGGGGAGSSYYDVVDAYIYSV